MTAPASNLSKTREYVIGSAPRLSVIFQDKDGTAVQPTTVKFKYKKPDGSITTLTYGVDAEIEYVSATKEYYAVLSANVAGDWIYRWESTGNYQAAAERKFTVLESQVV